MPHNDRQDITDQIDAATWTATGAHKAPEWNTPAPGAVKAILLDHIGVGVVDISRTDPREDVARLVGDPFLGCHRHLHTVSFWVGGNSENTSPVNRGATQFLRHLLRAVEAGDYTASDHEREHARRLLTNPERMPVIHGRSLITGLDHSAEPGELDENFQHWFTAFLDDLAEIAQFKAALSDAITGGLGIPADHIGEITFIDLH